MIKRKYKPMEGREAAHRAAAEPIDLVHLFRMTVGNYRLQHEILDLFDQQIGLLVDRMRDAGPPALAALAHTLKGSARSIGAWELVRAAEEVEAAVANGGDIGHGLKAIAAAGERVRSAIDEMRQSEAGAQARL
jgi:HPt (histidine-containing phosphotransfer) domain-containing protein